MNISKIIAISFISGVIFLLSAILILYFGHLNEDAYILFQYSKNFALGKGIVFDDVSGHTEGATDFLWMISLGLMHYLGFDLGISAALLNSIGLFVTTLIIIKLSGKFDFLTILALLLLLTSGGVLAALGGFSTLAYGGFFSIYVYSIINKYYKIISLFTLLIPLFRPDGFLIVLGGVITALWQANEKDKKSLIVYLLPTMTIGFGYFIWRINYFHTILPLPLLVKANTDKLFEGATENFNALKWYLLLLLPLFIIYFQKSLSKNIIKKCFAFGTGSAFLLIGLTFAHQSQNIGYRFQYPIILSLIFIFILTVREIRNLNKLLLLVPTLGILYGINLIRHDSLYLIKNDYIDSFPQILKINKFDIETIAVTEAGRFPFWYNAKQMIDLIGLNSTNVVKNSAYDVLNKSNPKLIFIHHAGIFDTSSYDKDSLFIITYPKNIKIKLNYFGKNPVLNAPKIALNYAVQNNYVAVFVKYSSVDTNFSHVYFIDPKVNIDLFIRCLKESMGTNMSYFKSVEISSRY